MLAVLALFAAFLPVEPPPAVDPPDPVAAVLGDLSAAPSLNFAGKPSWIASLTKSEAEQIRAALWQDHLRQVRETRADEWKNKSITIADKTLKFDYRVFGEKPASGRSLFISMHGGGNAPPALNDQQWQNQIKLYEPAEGVYLAPRAPTNTWNLWHEAHIDHLFDRVIEDAVALAEVDPNRVYLMGYSAGGDGVYQLTPRMADRFAAASMMAGHPNETSPLGLRNVPFAIHVGALDNGYDRNKIAGEWAEKLDKLHADDPPPLPQGYEHIVELHPGRPHWMNREDAKAVPWMATHTRNPVPKRVVWKQDDVTHPRLYWLAVDADHQKERTLIIATIDGQRVSVDKAEGLDGAKLTIMLDDRLVDLGKPVTVVMGDRTLYEGMPTRTAEALAKSLHEHPDPDLMFAARVIVELPAQSPSKP
jgi:hypothetical protein